jgi:hypothetical protein
MIQHIWTIPCRLSTTDRETNNVSLIEVLEEVTIPAMPPRQAVMGFVPAIFDVVTLWSRGNDDEPAAGFGRMRLVSPTGDTILEQPYAIDLRENRRIRSVGRILGFPAQDSGRYHFRVERRTNEADPWEEVVSIPIWVNIVRQPARPDRNGGAH